MYQQPIAPRMIAPFKPTFRLFIACEDQTAFAEATKVQRLVEVLCGKEINISRMLWNFSLLRQKQLREYALMEAAEAEMIIISVHANTELPPHVKCLMESLPVRSQTGQAALVTMIRQEQETWIEFEPLVSYLRQIAESRGLDFFCNHDHWESLNLFQPALGRIEGSAVALEKMISHHIPWNAGGIND